MVKVIELLKKKQGLSLDEFSKYWKETWAPLYLATGPGINRYVQNVALKLSEHEQAYDGIAESWWDDLESIRRAEQYLKSEDGKVLRDKLNEFIDFRQLVAILVEERVIK